MQAGSRCRKVSHLKVVGDPLPRGRVGGADPDHVPLTMDPEVLPPPRLHVLYLRLEQLVPAEPVVQQHGQDGPVNSISFALVAFISVRPSVQQMLQRTGDGRRVTTALRSGCRSMVGGIADRLLSFRRI